MLRILILFICFFTSILSSAEVYKITADDGSVTYSDSKPSDNNNKSDVAEIKLAPIQTYMAPEAMSQEQAAAENMEPQRLPYEVFEIISPRDGDTFHNVSQIPVTINLQASLQENDKIQVLVDGMPAGSPVTTTQMQLELIERGEHTVSAHLLDQDNNIIKQTMPVTFYLHRAFIKPKKKP